MSISIFAVRILRIWEFENFSPSPSWLLIIFCRDTLDIVDTLCLVLFTLSMYLLVYSLYLFCLSLYLFMLACIFSAWACIFFFSLIRVGHNFYIVCFLSMSIFPDVSGYFFLLSPFVNPKSHFGSSIPLRPFPAIIFRPSSRCVHLRSVVSPMCALEQDHHGTIFQEPYFQNALSLFVDLFLFLLCSNLFLFEALAFFVLFSCRLHFYIVSVSFYFVFVLGHTHKKR